MTKKKKKVNKKKNNKKTKKQIAIGISIFSIISLIFIYANDTGFLGHIINVIYFNIFGVGAYVFPILLLLNSILYFSNKLKKDNMINIIYIYLIFIMFLSIIDINFNYELTFSDKINNTLGLAKIYQGGGLIGAFISFFLTKLCGIVGVYLIFFVLIILLLMSLLKITFKDIFVYIKKTYLNLSLMITEKIKQKKLEEKDIKNKEINIIEEVNIDSEEEINDKSNNIIVKDYSDDILSENENKDVKDIEKIDIKVDEFENYKLPSLDLLNTPEPKKNNDREEILLKAKKIEDTLNSFGIKSKVVQINRGPTVTCYELQPSQGVKVSRIVNLADDLSLSLATSEIRIEAPIPGKAVVGIEVANEYKDDVLLKEIINSNEFIEKDSKLPIALGKSISGKPIVSTIDKMPHLLIAGATGSGKSVCINSIIMSILYKASPSDVKLILIDPKVVELSVYNGIPHLAIPVVTDPKKASHALNWAVTEMERRYKIFSDNYVRDIKSYNKKNVNNTLETLPYIVIIIDELSDLMMVSASEVEDAICRLAQMARACGIHLIVATQRPTVDVITGTIKANIPSRISFAVSSQIDSRTILDASGAEKLLGKGDMLFYPSNLSKPLRVQGAFISDTEVENIVSELRDANKVQYDKTIIDDIDNSIKKQEQFESSDELFEDALKIIIDENSASISLLQRKLKVGYARAGRLIDDMEAQGFISGFQGSKPRKVLISKDFFIKKEEEK